ncbi:DNA mismatch repair endonuclease MutH [Buchnera aphidicola]|uniref:DNA mismatch repair endonuclease MutH n=1 Tax=Buchnera aphidicola TaxID=9 RepID=UPI003464056B
MSYFCAPPINEKILLKFANELSGHSLGELSSIILKMVPNTLKKNKAFTGHLLEKILGANIGSKVQQDFSDIGVELKTVPVNKKGVVLESTFICSVPLIKNIALIWSNSFFYEKIRRILWIPIQGDNSVSLSDRLIGKPFLWTPDSVQENLIRCDWEEFMDLIILGKVEEITGSHGEVLYILKRSINYSYLTRAIGKDGSVIYIEPRCFYFRKKFTYSVLKKNFKCF